MVISECEDFNVPEFSCVVSCFCKSVAPIACCLCGWGRDMGVILSIVFYGVFLVFYNKRRGAP